MAPVAGSLLALILLLLLCVGLWLSWHRPVVGLGLLVAGMAFHSFLLMILLSLGLHVRYSAPRESTRAKLA